MAATFSKEERLCGKTAISSLMNKGKWGRFGHFKFCTLSKGEDGANRIMVSVPKKNFKRAVKRNLLKRRIREAYRTQKELLPLRGTDILFFYESSSVATSEEIRHDVRGILEHLGK